MQGGGFRNSGLVLTGTFDSVAMGTEDQSITVDGGAALQGTNAEKAFLKSNNTKGVVTWSFGDCKSTAADKDTAHFNIPGGSSNLKAIGSRFMNGKYVAADSAFGSGRYFFLTSCIEQGVNRNELPPENDTIKHNAGNITIA
ncbi:hypothetical protein D3C73_1017620 [compost metagenome]